MYAPIALSAAPNERLWLDFVHDQMVDGRRFRIHAMVDDRTRECLALVAGTSIPGVRVAPDRFDRHRLNRLLEHIVSRASTDG